MALSPRILVIEDEPDIAKLIALHLRYEGFTPYTVSNTSEAWSSLENGLPDVILVDWMLPGGSGLQFIKNLKASHNIHHIPILMVTAYSDEHHTVDGLQAGADDYITKPFSPKELIARIRAVLRRYSPEQSKYLYRIADLTLNTRTYEVYHKESEIKLDLIEFRLLHYLIVKQNHTFTRDQLIRQVWDNSKEIEIRTVDVYIKRLRKALGSEAGNFIKTVHGIGYRLTDSN